MGAQFAGSLLLQSTGFPLPINMGGTGQITPLTALNALLPIQSGQGGKVLTTNGVTVSWTTAASGGVPGGANSQIQFNDAGVFGATSAFTINKLTGALTSTSSFTGAGIRINGMPSAKPSLVLQGNLLDRWIFQMDGIPEVGGNSGSNFEFLSVSDNGATQHQVFTVNRASPIVDFKTTPTVNGVLIGSGGGSSGTVTYVGAIGSSDITVTGAPISSTGTMYFSLANSAVTPGTYTNATVTVDGKGRITSASNGVTSGTGTVTSVSATGSIDIAVSGSPITTSGTLGIELSNTSVTAGVYTNTNITVDSKGRITSASNGIPATLEHGVISLESLGVVFGGGQPPSTTNGSLINNAIYAAIAGGYNLSCGAGLIDLGGVTVSFPATCPSGFSFICHPNCIFRYTATSGDCVRVNSMTSATLKFGTLQGSGGSALGIHLYPTDVGPTGEIAIVCNKIEFNTISGFSYSIYCDCSIGHIAQVKVDGVLSINGYVPNGAITGYGGSWGGILANGTDTRIYQGNQFNINYIVGEPLAVTGTSLEWIGINDGPVGPINTSTGNNVNTYQFGAVDPKMYTNSYGINTSAAYNTFIGPIVDVGTGIQFYNNAYKNSLLVSDIAYITTQINNTSIHGINAYRWPLNISEPDVAQSRFSYTVEFGPALPPATFTDLDLSTLTGAFCTLCYARVDNTTGSTATFIFKTKGDATVGTSISSTSAGSNVCTILNGESQYVTFMTDSAGKAQWASTVSAGTASVTLYSYTRLI